ncbi:efflux RND transporter permease subunit [Tistrella bauzanensis]
MSFDLLLRQGNLIAVTVLALCVLGIMAAFSVPVQMIPDVSTRTIVVETSWPGATPQDIEQDILIEQEQHLRTLPGLRRIISNATSGQARIQLDFPFGTDINEALLRTSNALSQVSRYPENVDPPALSTMSASEEPFMYFAIAPKAGSAQQLDLAMVRDFVEDEVRPRIERVPGVALVEINGGAERQVRIVIDPERLAQRGLDMSAVRDAFRARNIDTSGGDLESGKRRVLVRAIGRFRDVASIASLVIDEGGGTITRLADVAQVRLEHFEQQALTFHNGDPALFLAVRREAGANVIQTKYAVLPEIEAARRDVLAPAGLDITLFSEDARYVEAAVVSVWQALVAGALLATGIMYVFLRSARTTAIGVVAIPICTIAAFVGLLLTGRTLNVISLAGIAFALGMTVDNAAVVLESIDQARRRGFGPFAAAVEGVRRVWPAVLACTVATVIVFLPIFFIEEEAGEIFSDIAIAIVAAVIASLVVAVTVVPALAARWLRAEARAPAVGEDHFDRVGRRLGWFTRSRARCTAVICGTMLAAGLGLVILTPPADYLPEERRHGSSPRWWHLPATA